MQQQPQQQQEGNTSSRIRTTVLTDAARKAKAAIEETKREAEKAQREAKTLKKAASTKAAELSVEQTKAAELSIEQIKVAVLVLHETLAVANILETLVKIAVDAVAKREKAASSATPATEIERVTKQTSALKLEENPPTTSRLPDDKEQRLSDAKEIYEIGKKQGAAGHVIEGSVGIAKSLLKLTNLANGTAIATQKFAKLAALNQENETPKDFNKAADNFKKAANKFKKAALDAVNTVNTSVTELETEEKVEKEAGEKVAEAKMGGQQQK